MNFIKRLVNYIQYVPNNIHVFRAITSVCAKDSVYFTQKNLFFLFYTITFTKHQHQFIYYIHFFIKIIFSLIFFIISHLPPPNLFFFLWITPSSSSSSSSSSHYLYLYLCLSFFSISFFFFLRIFFKNFFPSSYPSTHHKHSINTLLFPLNNSFFTPSLSLSPPLFLLFFFFFLESFSFLFSVNPLQALHQHWSPSAHHRSPSKPIHINPSPISINTDLTMLFQWFIFFGWFCGWFL